MEAPVGVVSASLLSSSIQSMSPSSQSFSTPPSSRFTASRPGSARSMRFCTSLAAARVFFAASSRCGRAFSMWAAAFAAASSRCGAALRAASSKEAAARLDACVAAAAAWANRSRSCFESMLSCVADVHSSQVQSMRNVRHKATQERARRFRETRALPLIPARTQSLRPPSKIDRVSCQKTPRNSRARSVGLLPAPRQPGSVPLTGAEQNRSRASVLSHASPAACAKPVG